MRIATVISTLLLLATAASAGTIEKVRALTRPWHDFQDAWVEQATVIVTAKLNQGTYPCLEIESGVHDILFQDTFEVTEILKGNVAVEYIDVDLYSKTDARLPPYFVVHRAYLLLLKPKPESLNLLQNPKTIYSLGNRLQTREVIAVLDLSMTEAEAQANRTIASRSAEHAGFSFTPAAWKSLRQAEKVDFARQDRFVSFLQAVVLEQGASRADVRSWLGPPDHQKRWYGGRHDNDWLLNLKAYKNPVEGNTYTELSVTFARDGKIASYQIDHLKWKIHPKLTSSVYMDDEELKARGLRKIVKKFARSKKSKK